MAIVAGVITAVAAVAGLVIQYTAGKKAEKRAKLAGEARREASAIDKASGKNIDLINRRKAFRSERVRRARIIQAALGGGAGGSSAAITTPGTIGVGVATAVSAQTGGRKAVEGASASRQTAAEFDASASLALTRGSSLAKTITALGKLGSSAATSDFFATPEVETT